MGIRSLAAELLPSALQGLQRAMSAPTPKSAQVASFAALTDKLGYLPKAEHKKVLEAFKFADEAHLGQFRASGEPYITHPIAVAGLCADWKLDVQAIMAALMHDTIEDQGVTKAALIERFGAPTAELVDGLTKLDKLHFSTREQGQAESFRKMLLAMARDVRVILIKLADRLHNMRTMHAMTPDKRQRIARETLDIYAPIAHRLGLNQIYRELQELSFEYLYPWRHAALTKAVQRARGHRRDIVERVRKDVEKAFAAAKIKVQVSGREKTVYSIYRKMREKHAGFAQVSDVFGFRLVVPTQPECYLSLGVLHQLYKPVPGRFKDFIAIPKANGYQSLHTTLVSPLGTAVEFQMRTEADARRGRDRRGRALAVQGQRQGREHCRRPAAPGRDVAAVADRHPGRDARLGRVPRARQDRPVPRRGLRVHAAQQDPRAAARRHGGGLCLCDPLRRRRPHAWPPRSMARQSRCAPSCAAATWSRSSPRPVHGPTRPG